MAMCNGLNPCSISKVFCCKAGDKIYAGAYSSSFPIQIYAASGHNSFTVMYLHG